VKGLVSTLDLAPTILKMVGIKDVMANAMKGMDLTPSFKGTDVSHDVYSETDYRLYTHKRSITTTDGWKFIITMDTGVKELYNLHNDPHEQANLVKNEEKKAYELEQKLYTHLKAMNADKGPWTIGCSPVYGDQCLALPTATGTKK
jgi:choline-sulfatase